MPYKQIYHIYSSLVVRWREVTDLRRSFGGGGNPIMIQRAGVPKSGGSKGEEFGLMNPGTRQTLTIYI